MYSRFSNVAKVLSPSSLFNNDDDYDMIIPTGESLWYKTQELNDPRTNYSNKATNCQTNSQISYSDISLIVALMPT